MKKIILITLLSFLLTFSSEAGSDGQTELSKQSNVEFILISYDVKTHITAFAG